SRLCLRKWYVRSEARKLLPRGERGRLASRACGTGIPSLRAGQALPPLSCASSWPSLDLCFQGWRETLRQRERDAPAHSGRDARAPNVRIFGTNLRPMVSIGMTRKASAVLQLEPESGIIWAQWTPREPQAWRLSGRFLQSMKRRI